jgi:hypothetical protein
MLTFLIVFIPFAGGGAVLIAPAFVYARSQNRMDSWLLPFIHVPAILALYWLMAAGFGRPQSLGNLIEFPILSGVSVAIVYLKVFWIDRISTKHSWITYLLACLLVGLAFGLRLTMPTMPE